MLHLGLESVNPQTLLEYNKKRSVEQNGPSLIENGAQP